MTSERNQIPTDTKASDSPAHISRRRFMTESVALGAAAGTLGLGISPATGLAAIAMSKHGKMGRGIYGDPARDFCRVDFATRPNTKAVDQSPGDLRGATMALAGNDPGFRDASVHYYPIRKDNGDEVT